MNVFRAVPVLAISLLGAAAGAQQKLAFVNSQTIVERAPGAITAQAALKKEADEMQARVKVWQDSLKAMVDAYEKARETMPAATRANREKAIQDRQADYARRAEEMDQTMQVRQQELSQPVMAQIREVLEEVRVEGGYTAIFDVAASGVIVAMDKNLDLTEKVISRLKPIPVSARADSTKAPLGAKPQPAGLTKKPPTR